jgi:uncharacterized membrane protein
MKSIMNFLKTTLTGGILFLLPLALLFMLLEKPFEVIKSILAPLGRKLPDKIVGLDGRMLLTIFILVSICFAAGLLFRSPLVRGWRKRVEETVLIYVPGYHLLKSIAADAMGEDVEHRMSPVLVKDGEAFKIGFLVEEGEGLCTIFFPDAPRLDAGEVKIVDAALVQKVDVPGSKVIHSLMNFGRGALHWVDRTRKTGDS